MSADSSIVLQSPIDASQLFAAALEVAGLSATRQTWHQREYGDVRMLQTDRGQGAAAQVSLHFPPGGGRLPADYEDDGENPAGYAVLSFTTGGDPAAERPDHERLITAVGKWLTGRGLEWSWQYEEDVWTVGYVAPPPQCDPRRQGD
jgi:hypothetical protein